MTTNDGAAERFERLTKSSDELTSAVGLLAKAVLTDQESRRVSSRRFYIALSFVALLFAIAFAGIIALLVVAQQSRDQLRDCVIPTGNCFAQSQARTGRVVGSINGVTILATVCAQTNKGYVPIKQCIEQGLTQHPHD